MYSSYEEYMQSVLGVRPEITYGVPENMPYFEPRAEEMNLQEVNMLYPEIYRIVYPMVQKACGMRNISVLNETQINEMVEEVYNALEPDVVEVGSREEARNGDVKNPRVKETRRPANNSWMRDLIRILILRELFPGPRRRKTTISGRASEGHHMEDQECRVGLGRPPMPGPGGPRRKATCYARTDIWECTK